MDSKQHIEMVLNTRIRDMFNKAAEKIDALKPGEKIPATELAAQLAADLGKTGPQVYPTLLFLLQDYPNVQIKRGAHGGIYKLDTSKTSATTKTNDSSSDEAADESTD